MVEVGVMICYAHHMAGRCSLSVLRNIMQKKYYNKLLKSLPQQPLHVRMINDIY